MEGRVSNVEKREGREATGERLERRREKLKVSAYKERGGGERERGREGERGREREYRERERREKSERKLHEECAKERVQP
jgi:hypothetical protein